MSRLLSDVRYGIRMLLKTPTSTTVVLIALSLGIGVCALMFSLIGGAVLPTLPVDGGDRIVRIQRQERLARTVEDYPTWSVRQRSFEHVGAVAGMTVTLAIEGRSPEPVSGASITPSILPLLSIEPVLGRPFTEEDAAPGAPAVVLMSHAVWRDRLNSDPGAVGRTVRVDGRPAQVVGVMPEGFGFPWDQQLWSPLEVDPMRAGVATAPPEAWSVVGRLRDGVSTEDAARDLTAITRQLDLQTGGASARESTVRVVGYTDLFSQPGSSAALAVLMLGVALLVLLVACSNVANVLLARATARRREIAIRLAIGASRLRVTAQLLTEISVLAAAGTAGGVAIALIGIRFVERVMPPGMPYWVEFRIDGPTLGFVACVAVLATLMAGLMPSLHATRANPHEVLKDESRGTSSFHLGRVMRRLIGVEIALSFVLLVLSGLFVRSAANFSDADFAFAPEQVYSARIRLPETTYDDAPARVRFSDELREALSALPEVVHVALSTAVPGVGSSPVVPIQVEGAAVDGEARTRSIIVTPGFFELFRTSLVAGRDFDARDRAGGQPVAVVNQAFAQRYFPGGALDRRIRYSAAQSGDDWLTIIGVTPDLMAGGIASETPEAVYLPLAQHPRSALQILIRPRGDFASLAGPVRESVAALDPDAALFDVLPLESVIASANSQYTWFSLLFLIAGGIALFLASIGLYGVMAFWVTQRTGEIGVRMALGGQRRDIVWLILRQGMTQTWIGLVAGVLLALPAAQLLSFAFYRVAPYDPIVFGAILTVLLAAAWLGCWLPARRATRINPVDALMAE